MRQILLKFDRELSSRSPRITRCIARWDDYVLKKRALYFYTRKIHVHTQVYPIKLIFTILVNMKIHYLHQFLM